MREAKEKGVTHRGCWGADQCPLTCTISKIGNCNGTFDDFYFQNNLVIKKQI